MQAGELAHVMQGITEDHLNTFGISVDTLKAEGKIWVIGWNSIEINRMPKLGEVLQIRIWPCKKKSNMYVRKYTFYAANGEPLVSAASFFLLMDSVSRSLADASEKMQNIPIVVVPGEPAAPRLILPFPKELLEQKKRVVQPEEIDFNGHLNNARYLNWAEELLKEVEGESVRLKNIWIQYLAELLEGEEVTMRYTCEDQVFYIKGYAGDKESFSVRMEYEK